MAEENLTTNEENNLDESGTELARPAGGKADKKDNSVRGIRTFEDDIAEYTKEKNFSILDIAAEEAKLHGLSFENPEEKNSFSGVKKIIIVFFIVLIALGGGYFVFIKPLLNKTNFAGNYSQITQGPILTDQKIEIIADQDEKEVFLMDLDSALLEEEAGGDLTEIFTVKISNDQEISLTKDEFFFMVRAQMPQGLRDYLEKDFMLLNFSGYDNYPVLVFKSKSYAYVFSEMLKWEKSMAGDLIAIFPDIDLAVNGSFTDKYIQNHDARVLENNGEIDLVYSFVDRKYLVITNSQEALAEIFRRFSSIQYANPEAEW